MIKNSYKIFIEIVLVFAFLFAGFDSFSQNRNAKNSKKSFSERLFIGGALGFSFGSGGTLLDISPLISYEVTKNFYAGIGLTYKYYNYKDYYMNTDNGILYNYTTNIFGGSVFARYFLTGIGIPVIEDTFIHVEVEPLVFNNNFTYNPSGSYIDVYGNRYVRENDQISFTGYFIGGGYRQMLGGRSYMYLEMLWNFNESFYSPYSNPRIRMGFAVGI